MSSQGKTYLKFGAATAVILLMLGYLAYTGAQDSKSYYVTIKAWHEKLGTASQTITIGANESKVLSFVFKGT